MRWSARDFLLLFFYVFPNFSIRFYNFLYFSLQVYKAILNAAQAVNISDTYSRNKNPKNEITWRARLKVKVVHFSKFQLFNLFSKISLAYTSEVLQLVTFSHLFSCASEFPVASHNPQLNPGTSEALQLVARAFFHSKLTGNTSKNQTKSVSDFYIIFKLPF